MVSSLTSFHTWKLVLLELFAGGANRRVGIRGNPNLTFILLVGSFNINEYKYKYE